MAVLLVALASPVTAFDLVRLDFAEVPTDVREDLRSASLLVTTRGEGVTDPAEILAAANEDYARLLAVLYENGYFGGTIRIALDGREAANIAPLDAPAGVRVATITVRPGRIYRFSGTIIDPRARSTLAVDGFRPGEVARTGPIRDAAREAIDAWRRQGHALANIDSQEITANHVDRSVSVDLRVATGPRLKFGEVTVAGNERTRIGRVRKIAGIPAGEVYTPAAMQAAADRLRRTGTFRSVRLSEAAGSDGTLDVQIDLVEERLRRFGAGVEIGSDEGLTLSGFWLHRNLSGGAERLRFDAEVAGIGGDTGGIDWTLGASGRRPATYGAATDLTLDAEIALLDEPDFRSTGLSLGAGLERRVRPDFAVDAGVELRASTVEDDTGETDYRQLFFPIGATLDRRDGPLDSADGFFIDVEAAPFAGFSGSESGVRFTADGRIYEDFGAEERLVLAARVQIGSILGASETGLPNDQRFYSGGGGTVRGQDYQALGVELPGGVESGGRSFVGASFEVRTRISDLISLVGFADWGYVGTEGLPGGDGDSHSGAGLGLRYDTGIGPLRVDLGVPVNGTSGGSEYSVYIGIGQAF
ncbi:MAG: BamA/TamA family outer membrane protein [Pseudomonadota bacterium]